MPVPPSADDEPHERGMTQVVAELQRLFPGRVLQVERVDESSTDDASVDDGAAATDARSADPDADASFEHDATET